MPIKVPTGLPALDAVRAEGMDVKELSTATDDTLKIALLNIMPTKETTEADFIRLLATSPHNIELTLVKLDTHTPKHATPEHMAKYYKGFGEVRNSRFDGFIITGAPVEKMDYEQVTYWRELQGIFDWAKENVTSTLYICWAAQAILYHRFDIQKYLLDKKMFGVFPHRLLQPGLPLFKGFEERFFVPHSRHTELRKEDILRESRVELLSESDASGVYIMTERGTRDFYITGHSEYALYTLDGEYRRDVAKGLPIEIPQNYYADDDATQVPVNRWRSHAEKLFNNWLDYYVRK